MPDLPTQPQEPIPGTPAPETKPVGPGDKPQQPITSTSRPNTSTMVPHIKNTPPNREVLTEM
jgi:hypothetical protein